MKPTTILILGCIAGLALSIGTFFLARCVLEIDANGSLSSSIAVFAAVAALIGLVFAGMNFREAATVQEKANAYDRRLNSFEQIDKWSAHSDAMHTVFKLAKDGHLANFDHLVEMLKDEKDEEADRQRKAIAEVLNFFEGVELAIRSDITNNEILYDYLRNPYKTLVRPLWPMVDLQQKNTEDKTVLQSVKDLGVRWFPDIESEQPPTTLSSV